LALNSGFGFMVSGGTRKKSSLISALRIKSIGFRRYIPAINFKNWLAASLIF